MAEEMQWEYRVQTLGSALRGVKDQDIEAALNAWSEEGWEVFTVMPRPDGKVTLVVRRSLGKRPRRERTWPGV